MISIIISSKNRKELERCITSIKKTVGVPCQIIVIPNERGAMGLCKVYNCAVSQAKYELLVFCHEDIEFYSRDWGKKVFSLLEKKDVGCVGVAGTTYLSDIGVWSAPKYPFLRGRIMHESSTPDFDQLELFYDQHGDFDVVCLDGVFLCTKKSVVGEIPFDENIFTGFHYYDIDFTFRVCQKYRIIATTDILIKHYSPGRFNEQWDFFRKAFVAKHRHLLPYTNQTETPDWSKIIPWKTKLIKKEM